MKFADDLKCESCINKEEIWLSYEESDDLEDCTNRSGMKVNCTIALRNEQEKNFLQVRRSSTENNLKGRPGCICYPVTINIIKGTGT